MLILLGCLLGFAAGAGVCLIALSRRGETHTTPPAPSPDREKLREQWDNFLNYNGDAQSQGGSDL